MTAPRPAPTHVRAVLWDLDGTLVDSERLYRALERRVLADLGLPHDEAVSLAHAGRPAREVLRALLAAAGRDALLDDALARWHALQEDRVIDRVVPMRGVEQPLRDLPARLYPFALVTTTSRALAERLLDRLGWRWRFEVLVTGDDVRAPKPDPEPYRLACERLGLDPSRTLAVEDSPAGIASARAAGCRVAAVATSLPPDRLADAHFVVSNVPAVVGLVQLLG